MAKSIYFVAGEVSGDNHGAALLRALRNLRPDLRLLGRGGPRMKEVAGGDFRDWIDEAGVIGLWEVIKRYGYFRREFRLALQEIARSNPDAVVLIDYPGFNLRLARALRARRPRRKILYYISPQVWAWHRGRIREMARSIDLMLCIFPFEADLYNPSGLRTTFVGHPMIERRAGQNLPVERDQCLVGLFPGSRRREVRKIFPVLAEAAVLLSQSHPSLRFEVAAVSREIADDIAAVTPRDLAAQLKVSVGESAEIMRRAGAGIVASGSATLEAAFFRLPFVLVYKVAWPTYLVARIVVQVDYIGMPNVIADREVVPEFIQHQAKPARIAEAVGELLDDPAARSRMTASFDEIIGQLGQTGASERAAQAIVAELETA